MPDCAGRHLLVTTGSVRRLAWLGCSNAANAKLAELHGCPIPAARALDSSTRHQCRACASVAGIQTRPSGQRRSSGARVLGYATRSGTETRVPNEASAADRRPKKAEDGRRSCDRRRGLKTRSPTPLHYPLLRRVLRVHGHHTLKQRRVRDHRGEAQEPQRVGLTRRLRERMVLALPRAPLPIPTQPPQEA